MTPASKCYCHAAVLKLSKCRNWGVCLMAADDLPVGVMGGGCCSPCPSGAGSFPHTLADLGCQPEDAVPIHVLASKVWWQVVMCLEVWSFGFCTVEACSLSSTAMPAKACCACL